MAQGTRAKSGPLRKGTSQRELDFAVQRIIDRVIFLRICAGRGGEDYGRLRALANGVKIYPHPGKLLKQTDDRYNSGLFHFRAEGDRQETPDELTLQLDATTNCGGTSSRI